MKRKTLKTRRSQKWIERKKEKKKKTKLPIHFRKNMQLHERYKALYTWTREFPPSLSLSLSLSLSVYTRVCYTCTEADTLASITVFYSHFIGYAERLQQFIGATMPSIINIH